MVVAKRQWSPRPPQRLRHILQPEGGRSLSSRLVEQSRLRRNRFLWIVTADRGDRGRRPLSADYSASPVRGGRAQRVGGPDPHARAVVVYGDALCLACEEPASRRTHIFRAGRNEPLRL